MSLFTYLMKIRVVGGTERDGVSVGLELAVVDVDEDGHEAMSLGEAVHVAGVGITATVAENLLRSGFGPTTLESEVGALPLKG